MEFPHKCFVISELCYSQQFVITVFAVSVHHCTFKKPQNITQYKYIGHVLVATPHTIVCTSDNKYVLFLCVVTSTVCTRVHDIHIVTTYMSCREYCVHSLHRAINWHTHRVYYTYPSVCSTMYVSPIQAHKQGENNLRQCLAAMFFSVNPTYGICSTPYYISRN